MYLTKSIPPRFHFAVLSGLWLLMQVFCYRQFGIVTDFEAAKYIEQAHTLLQTGMYSSSNFIFYSTQILLLAACIKYNFSFVVIVLAQIFFSGLSVLCFYRLATLLSNPNIAFFSTAFFLIFFYYHLYNVYLFTESLFFSYSIFYTYFLFTHFQLKFRHILILFLSLTVLYLTRPTGLFFLPATLLFILLKFFSKVRKAVIASVIVTACVLFYFLLNLALGSGGEYNFLLPYLQEMVICGVPTITTAHDIHIPLEKNSIGGLVYFTTHNFNLFFQLALKRLVAFLGIYRPYYSILHNVFAQLYFYLIYFVILIRIQHVIKQNKPEIWFLSALICLTTLTVMISCDEWHNRFILAILPFFLLVAVSTFGIRESSNDNISPAVTLNKT
jgi:4-amino-4-deoxy-L-arabinose transferase-like glycosyltransferase